MYKICLIDDKFYWIPQVINAIPKKVDYKFYFYNYIKDIEILDFDLILLDFYLDKDNKTALDIIDKFSWSVIIWFSSRKEKNNLILKNWWSFCVQKLRNTNINQELKKLFEKIII